VTSSPSSTRTAGSLLQLGPDMPQSFAHVDSARPARPPSETMARPRPASTNTPRRSPNAEARNERCMGSGRRRTG
jgi:hypothetical protein